MHELDVAQAVLPGRLDNAVGPRLDLVDGVAVPVDADGLGVRIELDRSILLQIRFAR
jgi:hypothetical protein